MEGITTVIVSALVGAVVSFVGSLLTHFLGARTRIDENLLQKRDESYKELWNLTGLIPMWPRSINMTYEKLRDLSQGLKNWYFNQGGLYLSEESRSAYGALQKELTRVVGGKTNPELTKRLTDKDYSAVQTKGRDLRKQLTKDLFSRSRAFLVR